MQHKGMIFDSWVGFSGLADLMVKLSIFKNSRWRLTAIYKNGHNFAIGLLIDVVFGSRVWFFG